MEQEKTKETKDAAKKDLMAIVRSDGMYTSISLCEMLDVEC